MTRPVGWVQSSTRSRTPSASSTAISSPWRPGAIRQARSSSARRSGSMSRPSSTCRADYRFRVDEPEERLALLIREDAPGGPLLVASQAAGRVAWSDRALLAAFFRYPLMTAKVMGAIHWEALQVVDQGARNIIRARHRPPRRWKPSGLGRHERTETISMRESDTTALAHADIRHEKFRAARHPRGRRAHRAWPAHGAHAGWTTPCLHRHHARPGRDPCR